MPTTPRFVTDISAHESWKLLAPRPGEHILDVGCGDGVLTKKIADRGCSVVGVDSSADFVASARKFGLTVVQKSASDMDFGPPGPCRVQQRCSSLDEDADAAIGRMALTSFRLTDDSSRIRAATVASRRSCRH